MFPKWSSIINPKTLERSITRIEGIYQKELKRLNKEIESLREEKDEVDDKFEKMMKDKETKEHDDKDIQTEIEISRVDLQTDYYQIYQVFGTTHYLWQMLQDNLVKYEQFNTLLENYFVSMNKDFSIKNRVSIVIHFDVTESRKRLTFTFRKKSSDDTAKAIIRKRKQELLSLTDSETFVEEMKSMKELIIEMEQIDYIMLNRFMSTQNDSGFVSFFRKSKSFKATTKALIDDKGAITRRFVWGKMIDNKLRITPELYHHFRGLCQINFPQDVRRAIQLDLERILRFYKILPQNIESGKGVKESQTRLDCNPEQISNNIIEVLCCFQVYRGDIGYVQGMAQVAYLIHTVFKNPIETFSAFTNIILCKKPMLTFYRFDLEKIDAYTFCLEYYLKKLFPGMMEELNTINCNLVSIFVTESFFTIFASYFKETDVL